MIQDFLLQVSNLPGRLYIINNRSDRDLLQLRAGLFLGSVSYSELTATFVHGGIYNIWLVNRPLVSPVQMEMVSFLLLIELLTVSFSYSESSSTAPPVTYLKPMWPPRHAQDLVQIIGGIDPLCSGTTKPYVPWRGLGRWRQLISSLSQLLFDVDYRNWLLSVLNDVIPAGGTQADPCNVPNGGTVRMRPIRSLAVSCDYTMWTNSSEVSANDVSTCSESDKDGFIQSVCENQALLTRLSSQAENNWLMGFCEYNTNPDSICHYTSWINRPVSAVSVAYCWLHDQDQLVQFLCSNIIFLEQLMQNPDNQWLDPMCEIEPTVTQITPSILEQLCNYGQWQLNLVVPSSLAFCAENDLGDFTNFACQSSDNLRQLLNSESNSWIAILCDSVSSEAMAVIKNCNYPTWLEVSDMDYLVLTSKVTPSIVLNCSHIDEEQFTASVCKNISLLLIVTKNTENRWVREFCAGQLALSKGICNYTAWHLAIPNQETVDLCWFFDQEQLKSYLCSNNIILQMENYSIPSNLNCTTNTTKAPFCSNSSLGDIAASSVPVLLYCAVQDACSFQQFVCNNSTFMSQLINNIENSWIFTFCSAGNNNLDISNNCSGWTSRFLSSSCPNCSKTGQDTVVLSICSDFNLVQSLSNDTKYLTRLIVNIICKYSSWGSTRPSLFLMSYCWTFDSLNLADYFCNKQDIYQEISTDSTLSQIPLTCHSDTKCRYAEWSHGGQMWLGPVNVSTVIFCIKEDSINFLAAVCNNPWILREIHNVSAITWTLSFCYNVSSSIVLSQVLTWNVCNYSHVPDFALLLCWQYDQANFFSNVCADSSFHHLIKTHPKYVWIELVCLPSLPSVGQNYSMIQCQYEKWDPSQVDISLLRFCAINDLQTLNNIFCNHTSDFTQQNSTILSSFCVSGHKPCSYQSWQGTYVHPIVVKFCWISDQLTFLSGVCEQSDLMALLLQDPKNSWLIIVCGVDGDNIEELVKVVCRYEEWPSLDAVPSPMLAFCQTYNQDSYQHSICSSQDNGTCNHSGGLWWDQDIVCNYSSWWTGTIDADNIIMCWIFDRVNFTTYVCAQLNLIYKLSNDPTTAWVVEICSLNSSINDTMPCLSEADKTQLQWQCDANLSTVCPGQGLTILNCLQLSLCSLQNAGHSLDIPSASMLYTKSVDLSVIFLLLLEEMGMVNISRPEMLRTNTLSVINNLLRLQHFGNDQKTELLQTYGDELLEVSQIAGEQASLDSWLLIQEFFTLPLSNMTISISRLSPEAAKSFLNILVQNWTIFKVPDEYLSSLVSTMLKAQVTANPELFADLVPVLSYLDPIEMIRHLPPMQDDKEVLQAIGSVSGFFSVDHRLALGIWLRRSHVFSNISNLSDSFIQKVGDLLPLLPLTVFQQLSTWQVMLILPSLPVDLSPSYQRVVANRVLQESNITAKDLELMGACVCQANVQDLTQHNWDLETFSVLKRNLLQCVKSGDLYPNAKMLDFLSGDVPWREALSLSWQSLADLSPLLPAFGYAYLQTLHQEQLLPALSEIGTVTLTPAQATSYLFIWLAF
ncbi:Hypothetical predicted protein [Pelobates cultripes]|uniref:Stereocilin LRR domain-containing protein n=1 Tax=Pelobates cultripes TaxID=61616 RepID=A0AAD1RN08_PELCU|nr:Hypothetical predicted protein [Pelobates cultripes]